MHFIQLLCLYITLYYLYVNSDIMKTLAIRRGFFLLKHGSVKMLFLHYTVYTEEVAAVNPLSV